LARTAPIFVDEARYVYEDIAAAVFATLLLAGAVVGGRTVGRIGGGVAIVLYVAYMAFSVG